MGYRIGIDVGGTFTDIVYINNSGRMAVIKTPSTPQNQAKGVVSGLEKMAGSEGIPVHDLLGNTDLIIHGTTVATNTMLEFSGAATGLITTKGFRDDIELRRGYKERIFNPRYPAPVPIAKRRHRLTVNERIDRQGKVLTPLEEAEVVQVVRKLKDAGIESIAVCLFFSFLNTSHEKMIEEIIRKEYPEARISLSHEVLPQIREFERVSTTLVNAYIGPKLGNYLKSLEGELKELGFQKEFFVMLSNGGIMKADFAGKYAVYSLLSGPAGGVIACSQFISESMQEPNLITVDMGGTSYDVSLIRNGKMAETTDYWFSRYRVAVPMLDIHTIGAGGGSIAWIDSGMSLKVGPQSAGANPGPACYGRGGRFPTVTDANLLLGYINPDYFLSGEIKLDKSSAESVIEEMVAKPLGMDSIEAAYGIFAIVNNNMSNAIHFVSVQKGYDPREFTLAAFGGCGAIHAGIQAKDLGIKKVIVPKSASAFSAKGMLSSNIVISKMRTYLACSDTYDLVSINKLFCSMQEEVMGDLNTVLRNKTDQVGEVVSHYSIDMHYKGETHEITVPLSCHEGVVRDEDIHNTVREFHTTHENLHTFSNPGDRVYFMNVRLETIVFTNKLFITPMEYSGEDPSSACKATREVFFKEKNGFIDIPIYDGMRLNYGNVMKGPCIIEEPTTSIVVYPGQIAQLTKWDNYEITIKGARHEEN